MGIHFGRKFRPYRFVKIVSYLNRLEANFVKCIQKHVQLQSVLQTLHKLMYYVHLTYKVNSGNIERAKLLPGTWHPAYDDYKYYAW